MDDLISRQAAIDAILHNQEVYSNNFGDDPIDKYTIAIIDNDAQTIAQLPSAQPKTCAYWDRESDFCALHRTSAQPEQRWIPVSEKNPPESEVICCDKYGEIMIAFAFEDDCSDTGFSAAKNECYMYNVVAWMEKPKPYKEGEKG